MGRPLRIEYPGAFYHVTSRGNERKPIFHENGDYQRFIGYLESATERYGARIHCFCLMPNHYHLLLESPRANLRVILHHLNTAYTNYFNAKMGRIGHLFQGRYRAILVDRDSYVMELSRYIHLNPVRARLVDNPSQYPWSSYIGYVEKVNVWDWLQTDFILGQMGGDESRARNRYSRYVTEGVKAPPADPLRKTIASTVLGSEKFLESVKKRWIKKMSSHRDVSALKKLSSWPDPPWILEESKRVFGAESHEARRVALYLTHRLSGFPLTEIGRFFGGISPSAVTQNTRRFENRLREDPQLSKQVALLKKKLSE